MTGVKIKILSSENDLVMGLLKEKLEDKGYDVEIVEDSPEEMPGEIYLPQVGKVGDLLAVLREKMKGFHGVEWLSAEETGWGKPDNEIIDPVKYKMPKYQAPQRAVTRPRQSVMRGK